MFSLRSSLIVLGAGAAASAFNLSASCQQTLFGLALNPDLAACMNTPYIANNVLNQTNAKNDPVGTAKGYLDGLCSSGYCSNATIQAVIQNTTAGCAQDLDGLAQMGIHVNATITTDDMAAIQAGYLTARNIACLKDTSSGDYCAIQSANTAKNVLGEPAALAYASIMSGTFDASTLNETAACTPCAQAAFSIVQQNFPAVVDKAKSQVSNVCGASFVDGSTPSTVQQTAVNKSAAELKKTSKSAASTSGVSAVSVFAAALLGLVLAA